MEGESPVVGRFFKVLMPGFEAILKLPPAFVMKLNSVDLNTEKAVLTSCRGSWIVDVKKCDDGLLHFFGKTWIDYVSDHELKTRDFIVFEHVGELHFNTLVFDETCCEKEFTYSENDDDDTSEDDDDDCEKEFTCSENDDDDSSEDDDDCFEVEDITRGENSQFERRINKYNLRGFVTVPLKFARSNGLRGKRAVTLRNATENSWLAKLHVYYATESNNVRRKRVSITCLCKFFRENKIKDGDKCVFKLDHSSRNPKHVVMVLWM